jgi:hypothetical protein
MAGTLRNIFVSVIYCTSLRARAIDSREMLQLENTACLLGSAMHGFFRIQEPTEVYMIEISHDCSFA